MARRDQRTQLTTIQAAPQRSGFWTHSTRDLACATVTRARPARKTKKTKAPRSSARARTAPKKKKTVAGPAPLVWKQGGPRLRSATTKGGTYTLVSHDGVDWTADFRPTKGRTQSVLFRQQLDACITACERDQVLRFTNEMLVANGAQALTAADLQGSADAWKRRRF